MVGNDREVRRKIHELEWKTEINKLFYMEYFHLLLTQSRNIVSKNVFNASLFSSGSFFAISNSRNNSGGD